MSEENENILKYFFLYGVSEKIKDILKLNKFNPNNTISPTLLASYSAEGKTALFKLLEDELINNEYLKNNIFPKKSKFFSDIHFEENITEPIIDIKENQFNQYINVVSSFDQKKPHFFHCFQSFFQVDQNSVNNNLLNFGVLIFYENVVNINELLDEKENSWMAYLWKSKYYNVYVPKSLILVSDKPIFSLMKQILEKMYIQIRKKYTFFPLEQKIINCFDIINDENKFKLNKEPLLPYCDLNIPFFFNLFDIKDLFLLAEYYLCSKSIIITCNNIEFLFPIYYILMTLFFPLNVTDILNFYKLAVPISDILERTLFSDNTILELIYLEEKLSNEFLENICKIKGEIIVYQIVNDTKNENENKFEINKTILKYEDRNGKKVMNKIDINNYETIIEKVCKLNDDIYAYLIPLIKTDIEDLKKEEEYKIPNFFMKNFDKKYETLRNHLMGLFIKFFVMNLQPLEIEQFDDYKIQIKSIKFKHLENDNEANELLDILETTQQNDLICKNMIIQTGKFDNEVIKKLILLDYFIKISHIDTKRSYFQPDLLQDNEEEINELNKKTTIIKEKKTKENPKENNIKNFDINNLFNISNLLTKDRNYFYYINRLYTYSLQKPEKSFFQINQGRYILKPLKYYQELIKREIKSDIDDIQCDSLKYLIFYGEKFELHFGQFFLKNLKKTELISFQSQLQSSEINYINENKDYEQYYKAVLGEAEIFYDLFITQIIPMETREETAACAIVLYMEIYIINLMSELNSNNPHNEKIREIILKQQAQLYQLLIKTKGFYNKFDFLITLLYMIISCQQVKRQKQKKFVDLLMSFLSNNKIIPSIIIILMNNHNITLDFRVIKKNIEKNSKIKKSRLNQTEYFSEGSQSFYRNNYEPINEHLIYSLEKKEHEHEYDILSRINDDYICEQKCGEILGFKIKVKKEDNEIYEFVNNPKYIIIKLLKQIIKNKSLFIYSFGNLNDIYQICMLDELYFKIGFFRDTENK